MELTQRYPKHYRVLALDMASTTGWALLNEGQVTCGRLQLVRKQGRKTMPDDHEGKRLLDFEKWLHNMLKQTQPDVVFFEEAIAARNNVTNRMPFGLRGVMQARAAHYNIPCEGVHITTVKKFATGSGRAEKPAMIQAARERFPTLEVLDDNIADALHILTYGMSTKYKCETLFM